MSAHVCIVCLEEFDYGFCNYGFKVCRDCIKTNIETNKCLNLYANGGNFPLQWYEANFDVKSLQTIITAEEKRVEKVKNKRIIKSVMDKFGINYQLINETMLYQLLLECKFESTTDPYVVDECKRLFKNITQQDELMTHEQIESFVTFANTFSVYPVENMKAICKQNKTLIYRFLPVMKSELMNHYVNPTVNQGRCDHCQDGVYINFKCNKCDSVKCESCGMTYNSTENHICRQEDIERYKIDKINFKNCPSCYVPVERVQGCPDMWCKNCYKMFNWNTLEIIDVPRHNPDRIDFMHRIGNRLEDDLIIDFDVYTAMFEETCRRLNSLLENPNFDFYRDTTFSIKNLVKDINFHFCKNLFTNKSKFLFLYYNKYSLNELFAISTTFNWNLIQKPDLSLSLTMYDYGADLINFLIQKAAYIFQNIMIDNYRETKRLYNDLICEFGQKTLKMSIPMYRFTRLLL